MRVVLRKPLLILPFLIGASSIATLLLYFYGVAEMSTTVWTLLIPATALLVVLLIWARRSEPDLWNRVFAGLFAGSLATLTYDLVRVPIVWSGVPVFKAISYFGTVILAQERPSTISDMTGWAYHFSNGVGFGLMYAVMVERPRWWTAVLWGVTLEMAMLITPYAEVFGYKVSSQFLTITIGAHVVYGLTLWAGLRLWCGEKPLGSPPTWQPAALFALWLVAPLGVAIAAADFSARYRETLPPSPPAYVGSHLYVTWDVPEPDRVAALWLMRRFADQEARFHFVPAFTMVSYGTPFDMPEAAVRREGTRATSEVLIEKLDLGGDQKIALLARMAHLTEISPWMLPSDPEATLFATELRTSFKGCGEQLHALCLRQPFEFLDAWFEG